MAYNRVFWENGSLRKDGYVVIDGEKYPVVQPEYEGNTPIDETNLNKMDQGIFDNAYDILASDTVTGSIKIGRIGIEWGTVNVTPSSGSSGNYYGSQRFEFNQTFERSPGVMICSGVGSTSINTVAVISVNTTGATAWISATNNDARTCRYIVVGILPE